MKKIPTIVMSLLVCLILLFLYAGYYFIYENHYKIIWKHEQKRKEKIELIERSYSENPNLSDALYLLDVYIGKEDYDKALFYSKACLELGADDKLLDGKINFFLSRIYHAKNNKDLAKKHLLIAIKLSKRNSSEKIELIKKYGLYDIAPEGFK